MVSPAFVRRVLAIAFLVALCPSATWADAIVFSDNRYISGYGVINDYDALGAFVAQYYDDYSQFAPSGLPFSASDSAEVNFVTARSASRSAQDSTAGPLLFDATGSTGARALADSTLNDQAYTYGISYYQIDFTLADPHTYDYEASLAASQTGANGYGIAQTYLYSYSLGYLHSAFVQNATDGLHFTGTLDPGNYQLLFYAYVQPGAGFGYGSDTAGGDGSYAGSLALSQIGDPIPEPTSFVLITSGLVGIGVRQWRKRRRQVS